jgi:hypothetical protein
MEGDQKKEGSTYSVKYAVIDYVGAIPIRKNNNLSIYVPEWSYRKVVEIVNATGLSAAKVLALSSRPCEHCQGTCVEIDLDGTSYYIPRGLFPWNRTNSGVSIKNLKRVQP